MKEFKSSQGPEPKHRFGVISDLQDRKGESINEALEPLKKLEDEGIKMDFITQIGDLASTGTISKYIKEAKIITGKHDAEKSVGNLSSKSEEYERLVNSPVFQSFSAGLKNSGVEQDIVVYALWKAKEAGTYDDAIKNLNAIIRNATDKLGALKTEVRHIVGNADRAFPEKLKETMKCLGEQNITSYTEPSHFSLDDKTSVIFWPSLKIDENDQESMSRMNETVSKMAEKMKEKETVLIFAHETPFKGPKKPGVYRERVEIAGLKGWDRVPSAQFMPVSRYVLELCRRLPADTKIALACGHMHASRETIEVGTQYLKFDPEGKTKLRLFGLGGEADRSKYEIKPGQKRTVDLYYLPEGEVGTFEISDSGDISYFNLSDSGK